MVRGAGAGGERIGDLVRIAGDDLDMEAAPVAPDLVLARLVGDRTHGGGDVGGGHQGEPYGGPLAGPGERQQDTLRSAVPAATPRTSVVAMTTVRRRRGRELFPFGRVAKSSGKLWRPMSVVPSLTTNKEMGDHIITSGGRPGRSSMIFVPAYETPAGRGAG